MPQDQVRRTATYTILARGLAPRSPDPRIGGQAQVVVAAEPEATLTVYDDVRPLRGIECDAGPQELTLAAALQFSR